MIKKDTEHRRLGIVHLLHSFGTGGMEDPRGQNPKRRMIRRVLARFVKEFTCVSRQMVSWLEADIRFTGNRLDVPDQLRQITGKRARESVIQRFSMADMAAGFFLPARIL